MNLNQLGKKAPETTADGKEVISSAEGQKEHLEGEREILTEMVNGSDSKEPANAPADPAGKKAAATEVDNERREQAENADDSVSQDPPGGSVTYSSHPIDRFSLGSKWQFDKGVLTLSTEDSVKFDAELEKQPPLVRNQIKKLDRASAEAAAESFLRGRKTQGIDHSGNGPDSPKKAPEA